MRASPYFCCLTLKLFTVLVFGLLVLGVASIYHGANGSVFGLLSLNSSSVLWVFLGIVAIGSTFVLNHFGERREREKWDALLKDRLKY